MRLIDADELIYFQFDGGIEFVPADLIKDAPTVDAEPVVRCKDCIYWQDNNGGYPVEDCKWRKDETPDPDDYCPEGYRQQDKEGEA